MSSTRPVLRPICHTSRPRRYELAPISQHAEDNADGRQTVKGYLPKDDGMQHALTGADIVVIPAGIPRQLPPHLAVYDKLTPRRQAGYDP
jgi:hypothetical protein